MQQQALSAIVHWTDPGPGGFYDDLGNPARQPHLVRGPGYQKDPAFLDRFRGLTPGERERLARRLAEPTLWDAFCKVLADRGLPAGTDAEILDSLLVIARDRDGHSDVWDLAEALVDHDEAAAMWRSRHVMMVERQIGTKSGTGGSSGAPYLRKRLSLRYYPLLWELRERL